MGTETQPSTVSASEPSFALGMPVEIDQIDRALKMLWAQNEGAMTRASLVNLAVYSEEPDSLVRNTELVSRLTENHACRAIVITAQPKSKTDCAEAWISAHCHVSRTGSKQICSEQISFSLQGPCTALLPGIVFSQLDSDLPFFLWWQGELHESIDQQLWAWLDRLIFDSRDWRDFAQQFQLIEEAQRESRQRIVLCDLNWTRLDKLRAAVAQFFDHPLAQRHLAELKRVRIVYGAGFRTTALLLAGWLAAQLDWQPDLKSRGAATVRFKNSEDGVIEVAIEEAHEAAISEVQLQTDGIDYLVRRAPCGDLFEVSRADAGKSAPAQLLPAQSEDPVDLLGQELYRGGPHRIYLHAVRRIKELV